VLDPPGYRIEGVAGRGGWSVVYRAVQLSLDRPVALKVIAAELAGDPGFRDRFRRECELAASIDHPNVMPIYDAGEADGSPFVAMRWVDGTDLRSLVAGRPLHPERAAAIVAQVAMALDAAHAHGLVHRDVKPGNVMVERRDGGEHAYLTDFGLAKPIDADPGLTEAGRWLGTVDFAAPEQIRGGPADAHSDVYALGGLLHYALTGAVPFPRADDAAKMRAHLHEAPPPLPPPLARYEPVVRRALAKRPAERFASAAGLGRALAAG
jgi:serine/threonine protein kinase